MNNYNNLNIMIMGINTEAGELGRRATATNLRAKQAGLVETQTNYWNIGKLNIPLDCFKISHHFDVYVATDSEMF